MALLCSLLWPKHSIACMHHTFFIHSSDDGHSGCLHVLALVNSVSMSIGVHVCLPIIILSGYMPRSGIAVFSLLKSGNFMWIYQESIKLLYSCLYNSTWPSSFHRQMTYSQSARPAHLLKSDPKIQKELVIIWKKDVLKSPKGPGGAWPGQCLNNILPSVLSWMHFCSWPPGVWRIFYSFLSHLPIHFVSTLVLFWFISLLL